MKIDLLEFLLETAAHLKSEISGRNMIADEMYRLGGEFVVYIDNDHPDVYRGVDIDEAMKYLNGDK